MKIKWLGHSCFLLTSAAVTRVLTDPFDSQVGYALPTVEADIVTTSHGHFDHNYIQAVKGKFDHFNEPGRYEKSGILINGISTFHDKDGGSKRGQNIIFVFEIDGFRICHCGDIGHILDERQAAEIDRVDVLMLPVGGIFTVNAAEAHKIVDLLKPKITIPMHYKTPALNFNLEGVDNFLKESGLSNEQNVYVHKQEIELTKDNIKSYPKVLVMDYK